MKTVNQISSIVISFVGVVLHASQVAGQPGIQWQKCYGSSYGEWVHDLKLTNDGGYVLLGETSIGNNGDVSGNHGSDIWVVKLDTAGTMQWQKCLGSTDTDIGYSIQQTSDGGYIVCGKVYANGGDVSGLHDTLQTGFTDAWIVKLDTVGNIQWQHCYGGSYHDYAMDIIQTADGGYAFTGETVSNDYDVSGNHGTNDVWLVKISDNGLLQWQKCLGGSLREVGISLLQTTDGGYIIGGQTISNDGDVSGIHSATQFDAWVVKTDSTGNIQWQHCYGGSSQEGIMSLRKTSDGGYIFVAGTYSMDGDVSGYHASFYMYGDAWVVKIDSSGNIQWQRCYGGTENDIFYSVEQTTDGGYILGGWSASIDGDLSGIHSGVAGDGDLWAVKINNAGTILWQKCLGGTSEDWSGRVRQTPDNGFIGACTTYSNDGDISGNHYVLPTLSMDCWVVKLGADTILSVKENQTTACDITLYPNPSHDYVVIKLSSGISEGELRITDLMGKQLYYEQFTDKKEWVIYPQLSRGMYLVELDGTDTRITRKLMVQ